MAPENGHDDGEGNENTVFIDTSLETHLATIVSDSDTVSDLKRKIVLEHRQCFPAIGDIKIHCLKVKRRGRYYHLADSMLVKSALGANDSQKNWFLSVDASHCDGIGIQHKPGDQLALTWVNDSLSIDNHVDVDRPSKLSVIHGSPSNHPKISPFVNQKAPSVVDQFTSEDDSCKKVSKHIEEEDRSSNLEPDLEQLLGSKVGENKEMEYKKRIRDEDTCLKKRRKSRKVSEEDGVLTDDIDMVKDMGTSVNDDEDKSKSKDAAFDDGVVTKDMNDECTRTMLVSEKKPKKTKKVKKKSAHDQVAPSSVEEDVGEDIRSQTNTITKASENMPDIGNEIPSSSMKGVTAEDEMLDDLVVDMSSTVVPTPVFDEKIIDEQKNDKTEIISDEKSEVIEKGDDMIVKEVKIAEPTESRRSRRVHKEKSRKEIKETAGNKIKKKDVGKFEKKDEIMKHGNDGTNEDNLLPPERKESLETTSIDDALHVDKDAEFSKTEMKTSQQCAQVSEKENENMNDTKKKKKKRKNKKSAATDEGEPLTKHDNVDLHEKIAQTDVGYKLKSKDAQISDQGLVKKPKKNHHNSLTELESVKSKIPQETSQKVTVSQVPMGNDVNSNVDIPKEGSHDISDKPQTLLV